MLYDEYIIYNNIKAFIIYFTFRLIEILLPIPIQSVQKV